MCMCKRIVRTQGSADIGVQRELVIHELHQKLM